MRTARTPLLALACLAAATACAGGGDGGAEKRPGGDEKSSPPAAQRQDVCAAVDDATMRKIADAIGAKTVEKYTGKPTSVVTFPVGDQCILPVRALPTDEFRITVQVRPYTKKLFARDRDEAIEEFDRESYDPAKHDIKGLGDMAYKSQTQDGVLVGDRSFSLSLTDRQQFIDVARLLIPVIEKLPPAEQEVTVPGCDTVTPGGEKGLGEPVLVRRDSGGSPTSLCAFVGDGKILQVWAGDDEALRKKAETPDPDDKWSSYVQKDGHYYQLLYYTRGEWSAAEAKKISRRFLEGLEAA